MWRGLRTAVQLRSPPPTLCKTSKWLCYQTEPFFILTGQDTAYYNDDVVKNSIR